MTTIAEIRALLDNLEKSMSDPAVVPAASPVVADLTKLKADALASLKNDIVSGLKSAGVAVSSRMVYMGLGAVAMFVFLRLL